MEPTQQQASILLESGTNEVEIIEFQVGNQYFGINVAKVRSIISYDPQCVTVLHTDDKPAFIGTYLLRGKTVPLIDIATALGRTLLTDNQRRLVMITEFNATIHALLVDGVTQIHRISWKDISPNPHLIAEMTSITTGSVNINRREILLLDLEHILATLFPQLGISEKAIPEKQDKGDKGVPSASKRTRNQMRIIMAEDSSTIRTIMTKVLRDSGYTQITSFIDGEDAFLHMQQLYEAAKAEGKTLNSKLDLLITDIEMPRMDGLTTCKKIRTELHEKDLPVIVFSSLSNEMMNEKCKSVGANHCISKPQIQQLVDLIDGYL